MWSSALVGPSSLTQSTTSLHRGPWVGRSVRAEHRLPLSTDLSPSHWTLKLSVMIVPQAPQRARFSATKTWRASRRRPKGGGKDRVMIQVQKCDDDLKIGKMILSKHPKTLKSKSSFINFTGVSSMGKCFFFSYYVYLVEMLTWQ